MDLVQCLILVVSPSERTPFVNRTPFVFYIAKKAGNIPPELENLTAFCVDTCLWSQYFTILKQQPKLNAECGIAIVKLFIKGNISYLLSICPFFV